MSCYIGMDIGGTKLYLYARHEGIEYEQRTTTGPGCTKEKISRDLEQFLQGLPFAPAGIGIAVPGLVEGDHTVALSDLACLNGATAQDFTKGRFPARLLNDVKAATLAGIAGHPKARTLLVVMAGTGLAVGACVDGRLLTGCRGFSGELGYCRLPAKGETATLDSLCGGAGLLRLANCSPEQLNKKLKENDPRCLEMIAQAGSTFGLALLTLLHLYNPDVILVGGGTADYPGYLEAAIQTVRRYAIPHLMDCCSILRPGNSSRLVALGAEQFIRTCLE